VSEREHHGEAQPQHSAELERMAAERLKSLERAGERPESKEAAIETAREQLQRVERPAATEVVPTSEPVAPAGVLTKAANYRQTMTSLRHRMKPAARSFSQFIHQPTMEAASEAVGKTVLRPSVSLGATTAAVVFVGFLYFYARHYGFLLKGSEVWIALLVGGLVGLIIEALYKSWRRLRSR
jgi:hypothetical protein